MKRIAGHAALTALILGLLAYAAFPQTVVNALTAARLQARAWTYTALQTFSGGANVTGGYHRDASSLNVTSGSQVGFEGQSGDTHQKRDADTGTLDTYKDGALSEINRGTSWQPPFCPTDVNDMGVGFCYDTATGKMKIRDAAGARDL